MDKHAAAQFLGVTPRTLERYVKDKKISAVYIGDRPKFDEAELIRFKAKQLEPIYKPAAIIKRDSGQLAVSEVGDQTASYYQLAALTHKMLLTIPEAAMISGLKINFLKFHIQQGNLKAKKMGRRWMMRPQDLGDFIAWLWEK